MNVTIKGDTIRITGSNGVDMMIFCCKNEENGVEQFSCSLVINGFEHGVLPSVEVFDRNIIITNNLEKGRFLYK